VLAQSFHDPGKAGLLREIADDQRLLMGPDPARRDVFHAKCRACLQPATYGSFQRMQTHDVLRRVVQHHTEIVKLQDPVQRGRQVLEQVGHMAVRGNRL
jgi:hypothetical protein